MKLVITDREPFAALNPLEVRAYLLDTGWREARVLGGRGSFWRHPDHENCELPLPYDRSVGDFTDRMRDAVEVLAHVEGRSPLSVLKDLERAGQDVIRVRLLGRRHQRGRWVATFYLRNRRLRTGGDCLSVSSGDGGCHPRTRRWTISQDTSDLPARIP